MLEADQGGVRVSWEPLESDGVMRIYCTLPAGVRLDGHTLAPEAWRYDPAQNLLEVSFAGGTAGELLLEASRGPWDQ